MPESSDDPFEHLLYNRGPLAEPAYHGLFVTNLPAEGGERTPMIVTMEQAVDGGMREFKNPYTDVTIGSCGSNWAFENVWTLEEWCDEWRSQEGDFTEEIKEEKRELDYDKWIYEDVQEFKQEVKSVTWLCQACGSYLTVLADDTPYRHTCSCGKCEWRKA